MKGADLDALPDDPDDLASALHYHPLAPLVVGGMLALMVMIALGRGGVALRGRRIYVVLGVIAAIWVLRFLL